MKQQSVQSGIVLVVACALSFSAGSLLPAEETQKLQDAAFTTASAFTWLGESITALAGLLPAEWPLTAEVTALSPELVGGAIGIPILLAAAWATAKKLPSS